MGTTSNLLYLLLLYAVLDKEGKLSTSTGLLIGIGIMVATNLNNGNNLLGCNHHTPCGCDRRIPPPINYPIGYNNFNPYYQNSTFAYNNALI